MSDKGKIKVLPLFTSKDVEDLEVVFKDAKLYNINNDDMLMGLIITKKNLLKRIEKAIKKKLSC